MTDLKTNMKAVLVYILIVVFMFLLMVAGARSTNAQHVTPEPNEETMSILFEPRGGNATEFLNTVANDAIRDGNFHQRDKESVIALQGDTAIIFHRFSERIVLVAFVDLVEDEFYRYGTEAFGILQSRVPSWGNVVAYAHPPGENV